MHNLEHKNQKIEQISSKMKNEVVNWEQEVWTGYGII